MAAQDSQGLGSGVALANPAFDQVFGGWVDPQSCYGDAMKSGVELPVAAAVEAMARSVARPDGDGAVPTRMAKADDERTI